MARNPKIENLDDAKSIMGALARMPPKHHDEMRVGKPRAKPTKTPARKRKGKKPGK